MKNLLQFILVLFPVLFSTSLFSQNVMINVLTQNSGIVKKGETVFFEVTINNTSPTTPLPTYKVRPQISYPTTLIAVRDTGHILPAGWVITSNNKGVLILTNGIDIIPANERRVILIALTGKEAGGPASIIGNINFSNGLAPGIAAGTAPGGDHAADNISTSSIRVEK